MIMEISLVERDPEDEFEPSKDFSWMLIAIAENDEWLILDASQGFIDCDALINGRYGEDAPICWVAGTENNAVYKLTDFRAWQSRDWESGQIDDWGWEARTAELLYKFQ